MANRPRRLLAILHADLAGYVRLMEGSEDQTVDRLQAVRAEIWRPAIEAGGGSVVNIEGDSVLAEFGSPAAAVAAAIDIQQRLALFNAMLAEDQRLLYRIGLHLGVVIVDETTRSIFGDGVNLAARIQALAEPGGIAVSRALHEAVEGRAGYDFVDGGEHWAKNVSRPLQIYHVRSVASASLDVRGEPSVIVRARKSGALDWLARRIRSARVTLGGSALWAVAAGLALLVAGGGYLAFRADVPATVSTAVLSLSAEQLEQALAERRQADALALDKRQLEAEARHKAAVGAEAKRQAEAVLERARQARQKAEEDLARLKAEIAARRQSDGGKQAEAALRLAAEEAAQRKAEDEAADLRQAEEEAKKKAVADAEAKHQADEALARAESERQRAERDAQRKARAEHAALSRAAGETAAAALARQKEEAEAAERGLRLDQTARAHLQVALTSLGFDTRGSDGILGPRTREMIVAWQKAHRHTSTGYLTAAQQQALLKEGAAAIAQHEERKMTDVARTLPEVSPSASPAPALLAWSSSADRAVGAVDAASYRGSAYAGSSFTGAAFHLRVSLQVANGRGVGALAAPGCQQSQFVVSVSSMGAIVGDVYFNCVVTVGSSSISAGDFKITGEYKGKEILLYFRSGRHSFSARLATNATPVVAASPAASAPSPDPSDGVWRGDYACGAAVGSAVSTTTLAPPFTIPLELRVSNGSAIWKNTKAWQADGGTLELRLLVTGSSVSVTRSYGMGRSSQGTLSGHYDGDAISAAGREQGVGARECRVTLTRS